MILIIDDPGYSCICVAALEFEGYEIRTVTDSNCIRDKLDSGEINLIITSYPYGAAFFDEIKKRSISTIILSDHIDGELIGILERLDNYYCMIKPVDYQKFRSLVSKVMNGDLQNVQGGYNIV